MGSKVVEGTEKYPDKRSYAKPKLQKFLKRKGVYNAFKANCKANDETRWVENLWFAFDWSTTNEGYSFWHNLAEEFDG